jgi:hypothetical protein
MSIQVGYGSPQRIRGGALGNRLGRNPDAALAALQASLKKRDYGLKKILRRLVKQAAMRNPGCFARRLRRCIPQLGCHRGNAPPA